MHADRSFARGSHGSVRRVWESDEGRLREIVEVRGVVEGASERVPMTTLVYRIKGKEMCVQAGITGAALGCDLLISRREIAEFERDGYTLTAR